MKGQEEGGLKTKRERIRGERARKVTLHRASIIPSRDDQRRIRAREKYKSIEKKKSFTAN